MTNREIFTKGIFKENPVLILMIGLCPVLATSTSANNGFGMGIATSIVLLCSNILISLIRHGVPSSIRIPIFIIIISTFVTIIDYIMHAYYVELYASLGIFIPLIVVNCMILGRAEAFAFKNGIGKSILDALGIGLGFTLAITSLGAIREILGNGSITFFNMEFFNLQTSSGFSPLLIFIMPPGAFIVIGFLIAVVRWLNKRSMIKEKSR